MCSLRQYGKQAYEPCHLDRDDGVKRLGGSGGGGCCGVTVAVTQRGRAFATKLCMSKTLMFLPSGLYPEFHL